MTDFTIKTKIIRHPHTHSYRFDEPVCYNECPGTPPIRKETTVTIHNSLDKKEVIIHG